MYKPWPISSCCTSSDTPVFGDAHVYNRCTRRLRCLNTNTKTSIFSNVGGLVCNCDTLCCVFYGILGDTGICHAVHCCFGGCETELERRRTPCRLRDDQSQLMPLNVEYAERSCHLCPNTVDWGRDYNLNIRRVVLTLEVQPPESINALTPWS